MKKVIKKFSINDLIVDVVTYAFTGWLVRQGLFDAFKANLESALSLRGVFRDLLRAHVRYCLRRSTLNLGNLIDSAFLFASTPEGFDFWSEKSVDWKRFCNKFQAKF